MISDRYDALLKTAAEQLRDTGMIDLETLAEAAGEGFNVAAFTADAHELSLDDPYI